MAPDEVGHSPEKFARDLGRGTKEIRACTRALALGTGLRQLGKQSELEDVWGKGGGRGCPEKEKGHRDCPWHPRLLSTLVSLRPWQKFHPALSLAPTPPRIPAKVQSGAEIQPSLLGPGITKSEASSENLTLCFSVWTKTTGVPGQPTQTNSELSQAEDPAPCPCLSQAASMWGRSWAQRRMASWPGALGIITDPLLAMISQLCSGNKRTQSPPYPTGFVPVKARDGCWGSKWKQNAQLGTSIYILRFLFPFKKHGWILSWCPIVCLAWWEIPMPWPPNQEPVDARLFTLTVGWMPASLICPSFPQALMDNLGSTMSLPQDTDLLSFLSASLALLAPSYLLSPLCPPLYYLFYGGKHHGKKEK